MTELIQMANKWEATVKIVVSSGVPIAKGAVYVALLRMELVANAKGNLRYHVFAEEQDTKPVLP